MSIYAGLRKRIEKMLAPADVAINGPRPWDIRVRDSRLYGRVFTEGSLGFGEAYMDGWWDSESLDQLIYRLIRAGVKERVNSLVVFAAAVKARIINCQSLRRAFAVGEKHYNLGNELFEQMLDSRMIYSCGYWKRARTLDQAQVDKLDLVCRKLHLREGQKVLDIGCGWGGTARYMAENYGVAVVGVTVSTAQAEYARQNCRDLPVEIRVEDYRDVQGSFDRIVSIGMFEHVGYKNYRTYFRKVAELLKENGIFLLHTIGGNTPSQRVDPWFDRYIFPNGMIPSTRQVCAGYEGLFVLEDWHNFGLDYDKTLMAWHDNFTRAWANLQNHYDERFRRMWTYYLLSCAGSFRARDNQVWQVALSRQGLPEGYSFPR